MIDTSSGQGVMQEAFSEAMAALPFVPKFFVDPAIKWLQLDGVVVDTESLILFMQQAVEVKSDVKVPLAFVNSYPEEEVINLVLQSQGVSRSLESLINHY